MEKKYIQYNNFRTNIVDMMFPAKNQLEPQVKFDESNTWTKHELKDPDLII